jgi:phage gpG-like protein
MIHRAAGSVTVRHRTDAKGTLMRTDMFGGKGLIFAKASHKRVLMRKFSASEHDIRIPARPFLMVQNEDWTEIRAAINRQLIGR